MTDLAREQIAGPRAFVWAMVYSLATLVLILSVVLW